MGDSYSIPHIPDDLGELSVNLANQLTDAALEARRSGMAETHICCLMLGVLKAWVRECGPDAERIARGAAMQMEALAEGQPLPTQPLN